MSGTRREVLEQRRGSHVGGIKDEVVALMLNRDRTDIVNWFRGERGIKLDQIEAFLRAYGLKVVDAEAHVASKEEFKSRVDLASEHIEQMRMLETGEMCTVDAGELKALKRMAALGVEQIGVNK